MALLTTHGVACDALTPPPSEPPPDELALSGDELSSVLLNDEYDCEERMNEMAFWDPCTRVETAMGRVAICPLSAPFDELHYGCGRDLDTSPRPNLALIAEPDGRAGLLRGAESLYGPCEPTLAGPLGGAPRTWPEDHGRIACFFDLQGAVDCAGHFSPVEGGVDRFPTGMFLQPAPEWEAALRIWAAATHNGLSAVPHGEVNLAVANSGPLLLLHSAESPWREEIWDTLAFDTLFLSAPERALLDAQLPAILTLERTAMEAPEPGEPQARRE